MFFYLLNNRKQIFNFKLYRLVNKNQVIQQYQEIGLNPSIPGVFIEGKGKLEGYILNQKKNKPKENKIKEKTKN